MGDDTIKRPSGHITPALVFHTPVTAERAEGAYVFDTGGKRYLDFASGLATTNTGHCHPRVVAAAEEQMKRFVHSGCIFHYPGLEDLAERLARVTPDPIEMFFFSNSGAEAVEGAVKLARFHTGRQGVISFTGSFHGRTTGTLALTGSNARYREAYHPLLPSVFHSPYPYCYRCPMGRSKGSCSLECFGYLEHVLTHLVTPGEVACVVIEPVLGEGGYVVPPADFIKKLRELCTKEGILLVADEVQSGYGRTGRWFACEHFGVAPDIMTTAKAMASGFPLSAVGSTREIMEGWRPGVHGTTFGGNPVSVAAGLATIDVIEEEGLLENATNMGRLATQRLADIQSRHPSLGEVRGLGLMIGVEFIKEDGSPDPEGLKTVIDRCLERGLILVECGTWKNVLRLMPPLNVSSEEINTALETLEETLVGQP